MDERFTISETPHRLQGPLSARLRELGTRFGDVQTLGQGITQEDLQVVRGELRTAAQDAEKMEHSRGVKQAPVNEAVPGIFALIDAGDRLIAEARSDVSDRIRSGTIDPHARIQAKLADGIAKLIEAQKAMESADGGQP